MNVKLFPDEDKHLYLFVCITLLLIALAVSVFDKNTARAFSVVGVVLNLAGVYLIAAGVVLQSSDLLKIDHATFGEGINRNPTREIIPNMLKMQSQRTKYGVACILFGSICQIAVNYLV
jgi:hypothetical protein